DRLHHGLLPERRDLGGLVPALRDLRVGLLLVGRVREGRLEVGEELGVTAGRVGEAGGHDEEREGEPERAQRPYGVGCCCALWSAMIRSTTSGSASVVMSPSPSYSELAILRRMRRMIFPLRVLGRPVTNWMTSGAAKPPIACRTFSLSAPTSSSWG